MRNVSINKQAYNHPGIINFVGLQFFYSSFVEGKCTLRRCRLYQGYGGKSLSIQRPLVAVAYIRYVNTFWKLHFCSCSVYLLSMYLQQPTMCSHCSSGLPIVVLLHLRYWSMRGERLLLLLLQTPTWPTASGITDTQASKFCNESIRNMSAFDYCVQYSDDGFATEEKDCVKDILYTDSYSWALSSIQSFQKTCLNRIAANSSNWMDSNPAVSGVPARLSPIINELCPNDCSRSGTCVAGNVSVSSSIL